MTRAAMIYAARGRVPILLARLRRALRNPRPGVRWLRDWTDAELDRVDAVLTARARRLHLPPSGHTYTAGYRTDRRST